MSEYYDEKIPDEFDIIKRYLLSEQIQELINQETDPVARELPMFSDSFKDQQHLPVFSKIVDHSSHTQSGYIQVQIDGTDVACSASSTCHPSDTYDEWIGHALVLARLCSGLAEALELYIVNRAKIKGYNLKKEDLHINE